MNKALLALAVVLVFSVPQTVSASDYDYDSAHDMEYTLQSYPWHDTENHEAHLKGNNSEHYNSNTLPSFHDLDKYQNSYGNNGFYPTTIGEARYSEHTDHSIEKNKDEHYEEKKDQPNDEHIDNHTSNNYVNYTNNNHNYDDYHTDKKDYDTDKKNMYVKNDTRNTKYNTKKNYTYNRNYDYTKKYEKPVDYSSYYSYKDNDKYQFNYGGLVPQYYYVTVPVITHSSHNYNTQNYNHSSQKKFFTVRTNEGDCYSYDNSDLKWRYY